MARAAEGGGFDSLWVGDHMLYRGDDRPSADRGTCGQCSPRSRRRPSACGSGRSSRRGCSTRRAWWRAWPRRSTRSPRAGSCSGSARANETESARSGSVRRPRRALRGGLRDRSRFCSRGERMTFADGSTRSRTRCCFRARLVRPAHGRHAGRVSSASGAAVDWWKCWYSWYGNTPSGYAELSAGVEGDFQRSACVLVAVGGGAGERPLRRPRRRRVCRTCRAARGGRGGRRRGDPRARSDHRALGRRGRGRVRSALAVSEIGRPVTPFTWSRHRQNRPSHRRRRSRRSTDAAEAVTTGTWPTESWPGSVAADARSPARAGPGAGPGPRRGLTLERRSGLRTSAAWELRSGK